MLLVAAAVLGLLLWMARDSVRPFIVGLLLVYLLDGPVHRLSRAGVRRPFAILIVYVAAIVAFVVFMAITLTPLINEILRFAADFPNLAEPAQPADPGPVGLLLAPADPAVDPRVHRFADRRASRTASRARA